MEQKKLMTNIGEKSKENFYNFTKYIVDKYDSILRLVKSFSFYNSRPWFERPYDKNMSEILGGYLKTITFDDSDNPKLPVADIRNVGTIFVTNKSVYLSIFVFSDNSYKWKEILDIEAKQSKPISFLDTYVTLNKRTD
jgi:hypothetical protein